MATWWVISFSNFTAQWSYCSANSLTHIRRVSLKRGSKSFHLQATNYVSLLCNLTHIRLITDAHCGSYSPIKFCSGPLSHWLLNLRRSFTLLPFVIFIFSSTFGFRGGQQIISQLEVLGLVTSSFPPFGCSGRYVEPA